MSSAEQQRRWRASQGARTGAPGRRPTQPCGTHAAYRRHLANGEDACAACKRANAARSRRYRTEPDTQLSLLSLLEGEP